MGAQHLDTPVLAPNGSITAYISKPNGIYVDVNKKINSLTRPEQKQNFQNSSQNENVISLIICFSFLEWTISMYVLK